MPLIKETKFDKLTIRIYSDRSAAGCAAAADGAATLGRLLKERAGKRDIRRRAVAERDVSRARRRAGH